MAARTTWNDALNFNNDMKPSESVALKAIMSQYSEALVYLLAPGIAVMARVFTLRLRNLGSSEAHE